MERLSSLSSSSAISNNDDGDSTASGLSSGASKNKKDGGFESGISVGTIGGGGVKLRKILTTLSSSTTTDFSWPSTKKELFFGSTSKISHRWSTSDLSSAGAGAGMLRKSVKKNKPQQSSLSHKRSKLAYQSTPLIRTGIVGIKDSSARDDSGSSYPRLFMDISMMKNEAWAEKTPKVPSLDLPASLVPTTTSKEGDGKASPPTGCNKFSDVQRELIEMRSPRTGNNFLSILDNERSVRSSSSYTQSSYPYEVSPKTFEIANKLEEYALKRRKYMFHKRKLQEMGVTIEEGNEDSSSTVKRSKDM